eukprot:4250802-Prymnesium_polylepis.1
MLVMSKFGGVYVNVNMQALQDVCPHIDAADVGEAFLRSASDAVAIAGSDAMDILGVSVQQLLE